MKNKEKKTYKIKVVCKNCSFGESKTTVEEGEFIEVPFKKKLLNVMCPCCGVKALKKA